MSAEATPEAPVYTKQLQEGGATSFYMIMVDEGWRSWILCQDMYEWAADALIEILNASGKVWQP